jgi:hypothetical protein
MNSRTSVLELVPAIRAGEKTGKHDRQFLDFVVDSKSLYHLLSLPKGLDLITPLALDEQNAVYGLEEISRYCSSEMPTSRTIDALSSSVLNAETWDARRHCSYRA